MFFSEKIIDKKLYINLSPEKFSKLYMAALIRFAMKGIMKEFFASNFKQNQSYKSLYRPRNLRDSLRTNLSNAMWEIYLNGLSELTSLKLKPETYELMTLLRKLTTNIDDVLDLERIGDIEKKDLSHINLKEALKDPLVNNNINKVKKFLNRQGGKYEETIMNYLSKTFAEYDSDYIEMWREKNISFEKCLRLVEMDSGFWMITIGQVLAHYNDYLLNDKECDILFNLGIALKFADDLNDVCRDYESNASNLMLSLIKEDKEDFNEFIRITQNVGELSKRWWYSHFPEIYIRYFEVAGIYYNKIEGKEFRLLMDFLFLPTILGKDYDKKRTAHQ